MKKEKSGSRRKCDSARHKKTQGRQREKRRGIKAQQRIMAEADFAQRLPDIHVPEVKSE